MGRVSRVTVAFHNLIVILMSFNILYELNQSVRRERFALLSRLTREKAFKFCRKSTRVRCKFNYVCGFNLPLITHVSVNDKLYEFCQVAH